MNTPILSAAHMADCTYQDFALYFNDGAMVLNISPTKMRIYLPGETTSQYVHGSYLSREKQWKEKNIKWSEWYKVLRYVPIRPIGFNIGDGAGYWSHNMSKSGSSGVGVRKAFPLHNFAQLRIVGIKDAQEKVLQNIIFHAFADLYAFPIVFHTGSPAVHTRKGTWTQEGFLIDREEEKIWYRGTTVGIYDNSEKTFVLFKGSRHLYGLLREGGADASRITILEN